MRVAIYVAPGTHSADPIAVQLRNQAESWLGRSVTGEPVRPDAAGRTRDGIDAITVDARRYGFHATLKAPFRLARGRSLDELDGAVARFAARRPAITIPRLTLTRIGRFFALVPGTPAPRLHALAEDVVLGFDRFRAPSTRAETARRDPASLTERQRELLADHGYPYVLDEFRFHLTLTDRVPRERQADVQVALRGWFGDVLQQDVAVDALALFLEPEPGAPFVLHAAHRLHRAPASTPPTPVERTPSEGTR